MALHPFSSFLYPACVPMEVSCSWVVQFFGINVYTMLNIEMQQQIIAGRLLDRMVDDAGRKRRLMGKERAGSRLAPRAVHKALLTPVIVYSITLQHS